MPSRSSLGIHIGHDRGAAIVRDGFLVAQIAEERLDRVKHSNSPELPIKSIRAALEMARIKPGELGIVGISYTNVNIHGILSQLAAEVHDLLGSNTTVLGVSHHECHAWSTYCTSGLGRALILVADGSGDFVGDRLEAESVYLGEKGRVRLLAQRLQDVGLTRTDRRNAFSLAYMNSSDRIKQISLGRKYEQFTYLLGFRHGQAGKTMALASYARPLFTTSQPKGQGLTFSLTFEDGLVELDHLWRESGESWHRYLKEHAPGIASAAQQMLEVYMCNIVNCIGVSDFDGLLCAAGGVFLSCRLNHHLLLHTPVKHLHVIPAAGDDGQCIGAAFAAYAAAFESPEPSLESLPYLGCEYSEEEISERLRYFKLEFEVLSDGDLAMCLASDLSKGLVVGLLRGRSESGPRALCHRSLLADPRPNQMKDKLNLLKGRELFRPFAPVVVEEEQFTYFDLAQASPYMLLAALVRDKYRSKLSAITHVDGTARVQAVSSTGEPFMHSLLSAFRTLTGFPVLLNTSFNLAGEPIVDSPHDAIVAFLRSDIDILVLGNHYVRKAPAAQ